MNDRTSSGFSAACASRRLSATRLRKPPPPRDSATMDGRHAANAELLVNQVRAELLGLAHDDHGIRPWPGEAASAARYTCDMGCRCVVAGGHPGSRGGRRRVYGESRTQDEVRAIIVGGGPGRGLQSRPLGTGRQSPWQTSFGGRPPPRTARLRARLVDRKTREPLTGATVILDGAPTQGEVAISR